jgi:hypothetical protein
MRAVVTVAGGLAVLVVSFWFTLKIIDDYPPPAQSDLDLAMAAEGFSMSNAIVGAVDTIERDRGGHLRLDGWAFDKELGQPLSILVLIGPKFQQIAVTNGARPDVTSALNQSAERTKNVAFKGSTNQPLDCGPHTIVAVNQNKHLWVIGPDLMVPRCAS